MGMVVRTNTMALNAFRQLGMNNNQVAKSLEKLSSGFRINRAGDDAAGLAISEKMKAQIKGLEQASANSQDGISLVQTAEGALTEVHSMLNRMVELATKSANGTIQNEVDREAIQSEVDALLEEIDRIGNGTNFNGIKLLDGTMGSISATGTGNGITVGNKIATAPTVIATQNQAKGITYNPTTGLAFDASSGTAVDGGAVIFTIKDAKGVDKEVAVTISDITGGTSAAAGGAQVAEELNASALGQYFKVTADEATGNLTFESLNGYTLAAFASDADNGIFTDGTAEPGAATAATPANTTLDATGIDTGDIISVNGKVYEFVAAGGAATNKNAIAVEEGANTDASLANLQEAMKGSGFTVEESSTPDTWVFTKEAPATGGSNGLTLQVGDTGADFNMVTVKVDDMRAASLGLSGLDVSTADAARASIDTIKAAINMVSTNRANMGALQNRLEYTINNLDVAVENMSAANSRIRDTDMAKEMMAYTKMNVLTQSAQAMLAQANQQPQSILQLLQ